MSMLLDLAGKLSHDLPTKRHMTIPIHNAVLSGVA